MVDISQVDLRLKLAMHLNKKQNQEKIFDSYDDFKKKVKGKNIAVLGIGVSNTPLITTLLELESKVVAFDQKPKEEINLNIKKENFKLIAGTDSFEKLKNDHYDYVFRSPGVRYDFTNLDPLAVFTSEIEVVLMCAKGLIIGVTGSDGKTTTTTLIHEFLCKFGFDCYLGGNIGIPFFEKLESFKETDIIVLELSSFQLHEIRASPQIGVVTNVTPNHLNWHKDFNEYITDKRNIFKHQNKNDTLILNFNDEITKNFSQYSKSNVKFFGEYGNANIDGCVLLGESLYLTHIKNKKKVLDLKDIYIKGKHNAYNFMAAITCVDSLIKRLEKFNGQSTLCSNEKNFVNAIYSVAKNFKGVAHRLEFIAKKRGVDYYDSSIDSSPNRTITTLRTFEKKIILIAGGKSKGISYEKLGEYIFKKVKKLVLIGDTAKLIEKSLIDYQKSIDQNFKKHIPIYYALDYEEVIKIVLEISEFGDVVVLSPASTSFDMFKNYEERGEVFKNLVYEIK